MSENGLTPNFFKIYSIKFSALISKLNKFLKNFLFFCFTSINSKNFQVISKIIPFFMRCSITFHSCNKKNRTFISSWKLLIALDAIFLRKVFLARNNLWKTVSLQAASVEDGKERKEAILKRDKLFPWLDLTSSHVCVLFWSILM